MGGGSLGSNLTQLCWGKLGTWPWHWLQLGWRQHQVSDGGLQKILAHGIMGGLLAEATGSDFKTGAERRE
nr:DUF637 domain-containing protein [Pseudomonas sp. FEN]